MTQKNVCDLCKADGFFARHSVVCAACDKKFGLCEPCRNTFIACSPECQEKWRKVAANVMREPLVPSRGTRPRKDKTGGQKELFTG